VFLNWKILILLSLALTKFRVRDVVSFRALPQLLLELARRSDLKGLAERILVSATATLNDRASTETVAPVALR